VDTFELPGGFKAAEAGHADVHQDEIRTNRFSHRDGFIAIAGLAHHFNIGFMGKEVFHPLSEEGMVIGNHNFGSSHHDFVVLWLSVMES
jgi:hypothetical protein